MAKHRKSRKERRLRSVAAALNACERHGMHMRAGAGAVFAHEGVILRLKGGKWEARMFAGGDSSSGDG